MSIFSRFARPKNVSTTAGAAYNFRFGRSTSGQLVNERTAMQVAAVYACVRVLSEGVAQLPLHLHEYTANGERSKKATDHPLYTILHDAPNPEMSSFVFRETMMAHLQLWGNAYAQIIRNGLGEVVALYPLMANRMQVYRDDNRNIYYEYTTSESDAKPVKKVRLKPSEVLHIPGLGYDGLVGYSPITVARNAIGMTIACEKYGAKFFANDAKPGGLLKYPHVIKDINRVREQWNAQFEGPDNAGKVAVLEDGMEYEQITINPNDAQFLETRKFQIDEIARIFRVPPHLIGDLDHSTFSNIEQQSLEFVTYSLQPWIVRWEQEIMRTLLTPQERQQYYVSFNVDGLLRGDYASRMSGYATGIQNGWMSPNDIRALENLDLIPDSEGGNLYMVNGTMTRLKDVGAAYTTTATSEPQSEQKPEQESEEESQEEQKPQERKSTQKRKSR